MPRYLSLRQRTQYLGVRSLMKSELGPYVRSTDPHTFPPFEDGSTGKGRVCRHPLNRSSPLLWLWCQHRGCSTAARGHVEPGLRYRDGSAGNSVATEPEVIVARGGR